MDQLIKSQLLYQLSYRGFSHEPAGERRGLHQRATGRILMRDFVLGNRKIQICPKFFPVLMDKSEISPETSGSQ